MGLHKETAKRVVTKDAHGEENGFLLEMFKGLDGGKTEVYLTAVAPGFFKGYHLHRIREARYICLIGVVKIITYTFSNKVWEKEEIVLDASFHERLFIPPNVATGIKGMGNSEAWLVNYPNPPYNPQEVDEQVEYSLDELKKGIVK